MTRYRNIELQDGLAAVIRHMDPVEEYREVLQGLQVVWDTLTLLGQMSGTGTDTSGTRHAFQQLTADLINQLAGETLNKCVSAIGARAQVAVDILVRNLYERTADIGFLATDADLRSFLEACATQGDGVPPPALAAALAERFAEYVAKYSVYSDILLLDLSGRVLLRHDRSVEVGSTSSTLVAEALHTSQAYVESFGHFDVLPEQATALLYSCKVTDAAGVPLGVLCLSFRFADEMQGIFAKLGAGEDWSVTTLLDGAGRVIASSDPFHIPLDACLGTGTPAPYRILRFAGQEYLAATRVAHAYQGYAGPGWSGHVMVPLQHAFETGQDGVSMGMSRAVLEAVMEHAALFGERLRRIPQQAGQIQGDLKRSVWNGNVRQLEGAAQTRSSFSKTLLWEISRTGARTQEVFDRSIDNLHQTVLSTTLHDCAFHAALAIDIMDRNLYERANDCRWWALTSEFRRLLSESMVAPDAPARMAEILAYINGLYTVYSTLLVFDAEGRVLATSTPESQGLVGQILTEEWTRRTLAIADPQGYVVSSFTPTPLYQGRPTYIYGAAIRASGGGGVVGGVGIVFDSAPQFAAMLEDALPRDAEGEVRPGTFAVFVDRAGQVIACSDARHAPGSLLPLDGASLTVDDGSVHSGVVELEGAYCAIGRAASSGYREYKGPRDPYRNEVQALVLLPLCTASALAPAFTVPAPSLVGDPPSEHARLELATFLIGSEWYAMRAGDIIEAVDATALTAVPGAGPELAGYLRYERIPMPVFRLHGILSGDQPSAAPGTGSTVVMVRRNANSRFGILVDALGDIPEVRATRVSPLPPVLGGAAILADAIVPLDGADAGRMMLVLGPERIHARLARAAIGLGEAIHAAAEGGEALSA